VLLQRCCVGSWDLILSGSAVTCSVATSADGIKAHGSCSARGLPCAFTCGSGVVRTYAAQEPCTCTLKAAC
jgi:hypothetical protein